MSRLIEKSQWKINSVLRVYCVTVVEFDAL